MGQSGILDDMTPRDYVRVLFRHRAAVLAGVITVLGAVGIGMLLMTPTYEAQVKMLISGQKPAQADYYTDLGLTGLRSAQITLTQTEIVTSDPVIERAVGALGLAKKPFDYEKRFCSPLKRPLVNLAALRLERKLQGMPPEQQKALRFRIAMEDLRDRLDVDPVRDTDLFLIKVKDFNPLGAAVSANVVSRSYAMFDLEQQLAETKLKYGEKNQAVIQLEAAIEKMAQGLNGAPLPPIEAIGSATVKIIEQAKVPLKPAGVPKIVTVILALAMSLFVGIMLAFLFEYTDQTFRSPREVESVLGVPCLGSLRRKAKPEDCRELAERLYLAVEDTGVKVLLVASALPREGVAQLIAQLGAYMGERLDRRVLLIDGNLRTPVLHKLLKLPESTSLADALHSRRELREAVTPIGANLDALLGGADAPNPITMPDPRMKALLDQARAAYDLVLVSAPPFGRFKDAAILAGFTDSMMVVVNERTTRRQVVKAALASLNGRQPRVLGAVLNNRRYVIPKLIYDLV